MQQYAGI